MPLFKEVRADVTKYEDVTHTDFRGGIFYIFYNLDGKEKFKKLPYRANKDQLIKVIEKIRKETNYYQRRKEKIDSGYYKLKENKPVFAVGGEDEK